MADNVDSLTTNQSILSGDTISPATTNSNPAASGAITLVSGQNQVTLLNGTGDDSVISGSVLTIDGTDTLIVNGNSTITLSGTGNMSLPSSNKDAITILGGNSDTSLQAETSNNSSVVSLDLAESGNGTSNRPLKRMELVYKDIVLKFAINPSDYTQKEPNRATITQTKGGAWIDAWGAGIVEFNIKGITGVSGRKISSQNGIRYSNTIDIGYQRWKEMRDLIREIYQDVQDGEPVTELIKFYNYTDNEFWYCYPTQSGIELYRSRSKPHVYQYTISLWGIRRIGEPESTTGVIGNPNKEYVTSGVDDSESEDIQGVVSSATETINGGEVDPDVVEEGENRNSSQGDNQENDTQTTTDTTATVSGGNAYVTKTLAPGIQADTAIVTNTRTKTNAVIRSQCSTYAQEMSPLIGGHNGLLSPKTAYNCAKDILISTTGIVLNVKGFDARTLNKDYIIKTEGYIKYHRLMEEVLFAALVSRETYLLQQQILDYSTDVLSPDYVLPIGATPRERVMQAVEYPTKLDSTIYQLVTKYQPKYYLSKNDVKYIKMVMLETMMVYLQLYQMSESTGQIITTLTPANMKTFIKNLDALIIYLEVNTNDTNEFFVRNVMWELRKLENIVVQVAADIVEYL